MNASDPVLKVMGASASVTIPKGANSWAFILQSGTGTFGGAAATVGLPMSGGKLANDVIVSTGSTSTASVMWEAGT